jgi:hypothetical protein
VKSTRDGPAFRPLTLLATELEEPLSRCPTSEVLCRQIETIRSAPTARRWRQRWNALVLVRFGQDCTDGTGITRTAEDSPEPLESY